MPRASTLPALLVATLLLLGGCGRSDLTDPDKPAHRLVASGTAMDEGGDVGAVAGGGDVAGTPGPGNVPAQPPEDFVREFFFTYMDTLEDTRWFENRDLLSTWFSSSLTGQLLRNDAACQEDPENGCRLDFDPIIDAQDYGDDLASTAQTERIGTGNPVKVRITFTNFDAKVTMTYTLVQVDDGWRISEIQSPNYGALSQILSGSSAAANGPAI